MIISHTYHTVSRPSLKKKYTKSPSLSLLSPFRLPTPQPQSPVSRFISSREIREYFFFLKIIFHDIFAWNNDTVLNPILSDSLEKFQSTDV